MIETTADVVAGDCRQTAGTTARVRSSASTPRPPAAPRSTGTPSRSSARSASFRQIRSGQEQHRTDRAGSVPRRRTGERRLRRRAGLLRHECRRRVGRADRWRGRRHRRRPGRPRSRRPRSRRLAAGPSPPPTTSRLRSAAYDAGDRVRIVWIDPGGQPARRDGEARSQPGGLTGPAVWSVVRADGPDFGLPRGRLVRCARRRPKARPGQQQDRTTQGPVRLMANGALLVDEPAVSWSGHCRRGCRRGPCGSGPEARWPAVAARAFRSA